MSSQDKKPPTSTITIGGTRQVAGTASGGGSREDPVAQSGNWDAQQFRNEEYGKWAANMAASFGGFGFGGFGYGGGYGAEGGGYSDPSYIEEAAAQIEAMTQVAQTGLEALPPDLLATIAPDTLLRFAFSPEDMQHLDLNGEHDAIAEVRNVLTVNNPTKELMAHLVKTGQFADVVWSGHGSDKGLWITNAEGKAEMMPAGEIAAMFEDTSVKEVLLNVCRGGNEVDDALNEAGVDTFAYKREIDDKEASEDAKTFAETGTLASVDAGIQVTETGQIKEGGEHQLAKDPAAEAAAAAAAAAMAGMAGLGGAAVGAGTSALVDAAVTGSYGAEGGAVAPAASYGAEGGTVATMGGVGAVADQLAATGYGAEGGYVDPYAYYGYGFNYSGMQMV